MKAFIVSLLVLGSFFITTQIVSAQVWEKAFGESWEWHNHYDNDENDDDFAIYFKFPHENRTKSFDVKIRSTNLAVSSLLSGYSLRGEIIVQFFAIDNIHQHVRVVLGDSGINTLKFVFGLTDESIARSLYFEYPLFGDETKVPPPNNAEFNLVVQHPNAPNWESRGVWDGTNTLTMYDFDCDHLGTAVVLWVKGPNKWESFPSRQSGDNCLFNISGIRSSDSVAIGFPLVVTSAWYFFVQDGNCTNLTENGQWMVLQPGCSSGGGTAPPPSDPPPTNPPPTTTTTNFAVRYPNSPGWEGKGYWDGRNTITMFDFDCTFTGNRALLWIRGQNKWENTAGSQSGDSCVFIVTNIRSGDSVAIGFDDFNTPWYYFSETGQCTSLDNGDIGWLRITPNCSTRSSALADASALSIRAVTHSNHVIFEVNSNEAVSTQLQIFDLNGDVVFDSGMQFTGTLQWNYLNTSGNRVANGVYLYVIKSRDSRGITTKSKLHKLLVLR